MPKVVWLLGIELMQTKCATHIFYICKLGNLAFTIASNVNQSRIHIRRLIETMQRRDRKELIAGPMIDQRLKDRKIADVLIGHHLRQRLEFFRRIARTFSLFGEFLANLPISGIGLGFFSEIEIPRVKRGYWPLPSFAAHHGNAPKG